MFEAPACEGWGYKGGRLKGSKSFQSTVSVMGLGKYGGGTQTIEHPSLQWGKSFQATTKILAGKITMTSCCARWLTPTHDAPVYHIMKYNPTEGPQYNRPWQAGKYRQEGVGWFKGAIWSLKNRSEYIFCIHLDILKSRVERLNKLFENYSQQTHSKLKNTKVVRDVARKVDVHCLQDARKECRVPNRWKSSRAPCGNWRRNLDTDRWSHGEQICSVQQTGEPQPSSEPQTHVSWISSRIRVWNVLWTHVNKYGNKTCEHFI